MGEVLIFNETPSGTLVGNEFAEDTGFEKKKPKASKFKVVRVKGQVTWKYQGPGDDDAQLLLKRLVTTNGKTRVSDELTLAEIAHGASSDEFTTLEFDLKPGNNPDNNKFWETCGEGKVMSGLNYNLDPQVSLQPRNCYRTRAHTHTHTHHIVQATWLYTTTPAIVNVSLHSRTCMLRRPCMMRP